MGLRLSYIYQLTELHLKCLRGTLVKTMKFVLLEHVDVLRLLTAKIHFCVRVNREVNL